MTLQNVDWFVTHLSCMIFSSAFNYNERVLTLTPDICLFLRMIKFCIKNVRPKNNLTISLPCISSLRVANHVKVFVNYG